MMESPSHETRPEEPRPLSLGWAAAAVVAVLVLAVLGYSIYSSTRTSHKALTAGSLASVGEEAPGFRLTAFDGVPMDLSSQRGRVVVVNFFASWCTPCRQEAAALESVWRTYQASGVQFYGIAYKDAAAKAQAFLDEFNVTYPSTAEASNRTARAFGVTGVPETYVIDQEGRVAQPFIGPVDAQELAGAIELLLTP